MTKGVYLMKIDRKGTDLRELAVREHLMKSSLGAIPS
jgi:hypothetical protein